MRKKCILMTLIITLLMNSIIIIPVNSVATVEEGKFGTNEIPYNLSIIKTGSYTNKYNDQLPNSDNNKSIYLDSEGRLWEIDKDNYQLRQIFKTHKFSDIAVGEKHVIALDKEGYLWTWGSNKYGQLGNGTKDSSTEPVSIYPTKTFKMIACSNNASFAIDFEGKLYAWGSNKYSETQTHNTTMTESFSSGSSQTRYNYIKIQTVPFNILEDYRFNKVVASQDSVIAIDSEGYAWGWGKNLDGHVGNYSSNSEVNYWEASIANAEFKYLKDAMKISTTKKFIDVSIGYNHSAFIDEEGKVYTIGSCEKGALGNGTSSDGSIKYLVQPTYTEDMSFKDIIAGYHFTGFIDENDNVWMCGNNAWGYIGNGTTTDTATIVRVKVDGITFVNFLNDTASRSIHVLDINGDLWGWGLPKELLADATPSGYCKSKPVQITGKVNQYTVTFKDGNTILKTETVAHGEGATAPEQPIKEGYTFVGWDKEFSNITSDLTINAEWTANTYNVTLNTNGGTIKEGENVTSYTYGIGVTLPIPTKTGYTFAGWYKTEELTGEAIHTIGTEAIGDKTYYAKWEAGEGIIYKVEHYKQNLETNTYEKVETDELTGTTGLNVVATAKTYEGYRENKTHKDRVATGEIKADGSLVLKLYYDINKYTVTFKDGDTILKTETVAHGEGATAPEQPTKEGYTFVGWDKEFSNITSDLTINAEWTANTYNVTLNTNGGTIKEGENVTSYTYGIGVTLPIPTKTGYTFAGWYKTEELTGEAIHTIGTEAIGDKTYYAKWEAGEGIIYKVEHYKQNLETNTYEKVETDELTGTTGLNVVATAKTYEGYRENKTHKDRVATGEIKADGSLVLKLYYDINKYTVTFKDGDTILKTETVAHGEGATAPEQPTKEGYTFVGWNKEFNNITSDLIVNAKWTKNQYKVIFKDGDKVVKEEVVSHGGNATPPVLTKPGYILSWDKETDNISKDTTFTAVWTKDPNYVDPNGNKKPDDGKEEKPTFLPQTGENCIITGTMSVLIAVAIFVYLKYRKISNM